MSGQQGYEKSIGCEKNALGNGGYARRAIKKHQLIARLECLEQVAQPFALAIALAQEQIHVAVGKICREQIQTGAVAFPDDPRQRSLAFQKRLGTAFDTRFYREAVAGCALWIEIPDQRAQALSRGAVREIHGCRRFTYSTFQSVAGQDPHEAATTSMRRNLSWLACEANSASSGRIFSSFSFPSCSSRAIS